MITYKPLPIKDKEVQKYLCNVEFKEANISAFKVQYHSWIYSSKNTVVNGLDCYSRALTDGVTGAFSDFLHHYSNKKLIVFNGEYPYHRDTGATVINDVDELTRDSRLILSTPFSATGNIHKKYIEIMEKCIVLDIPVFIDMAYFGACCLGKIDVTYSCIKMVSFSLSKTFGTGKCKIGICYYRDIPIGPMQMLNKYNYVNHIAINIHNPLIQNFSPDYMFDKYRKKQEAIAIDLSLDCSDTIFLCTTHDSKYNGFSRSGLINRIGIADLLIKDTYNKENLQWQEKP